MPTANQKLSALLKLHKVVKEYRDEEQKDPLPFYTPNPIQDKFHRSPKRNRWFFTGNRFGKTTAKAVEGCCFARGEHPYRKISVPNEGWVVSVDFAKSKDVVEPVYKKYLGTHLKQWFERERIAELDNGSKISFKSADARGGARKFSGASIRWADLDEDIMEDIYKEVMMRTFDQKGDMWGGVTPKYTHSNWMYKSIYLNQYKDPEVECFFGSIYDNIGLPLEEVERIKHIHSKDELDTVLYGHFLMRAGLVYKDFEDDINLINPFEIPKHWFKFRIIDDGIHQTHPEAVLWVALSPENDHYYYREYVKSDQDRETNCWWIKQMTPKEEKIKMSLLDFGSASKRSATNLKTVIREYRDNGIVPLIPAPYSEVFTRISRVSSALRNRKIFIFRTLVNTIEEFKTWNYEKSGKPNDLGDDCLDNIGHFTVYNPKYENLIQVSNMGSFIELKPTTDPLRGLGR